MRLGHRLGEDSVKQAGGVSAGPAGPVPNVDLLYNVIQAPPALAGSQFPICRQEGRRGLHRTLELPRSGRPDLQLCGRSLSGQEANFRVGAQAQCSLHVQMRAGLVKSCGR